MAGGQLVEVTGRGFDSDTVISICDRPCDLQGDVTPTTLTCRTPAYSGNDTGDVDCEVVAVAGEYYENKDNCKNQENNTAVSNFRKGNIIS